MTASREPPISREPSRTSRQVTPSSHAPVAFRGNAVRAVAEPLRAIPLRSVKQRPAIHVVPSGYDPGTQPDPRSAELPEAQLIAVGYRADEREGVIHVLTLQIGGERIEIPCDRAMADAFASSMGAGKLLRFRLSLEPI